MLSRPGAVRDENYKFAVGRGDRIAFGKRIVRQRSTAKMFVFRHQSIAASSEKPIGIFTKSVIWSNALSINSNTFAECFHALINWQRTI
jgi:hypothetical protein